MTEWKPPPTNAERRKQRAAPPKRASKTPDDAFVPTSIEELTKHTKQELVQEINRLQTTVYELAVELGLARRTPSSEYRIDLHFATNMIIALKASNMMRLK